MGSSDATLFFDLDGLTVTASLPVPTWYTPVHNRVGELRGDKAIAEWVNGQDWFNDLVNSTVDLFLNTTPGDTSLGVKGNLESDITDMLGAKLLQTALVLYQDRLNELSPTQLTNRIRFYRPELIHTTPEDPDYTVTVDMAAIANWVSSLRLTGIGTTLLPLAVRQWLTAMVCQTEKPKTLNYYDWLDKVVGNINRFGADGVDAGIWSVISPGADQVIRSLNPDLPTLERVLGLVLGPKPDVSDLLIPTGPGPVGVSEGLAAAAAGSRWAPDEDGVISYSSLAREGLSVRLVVSEDGISPIAVANQALDAVASIDTVAAQLHQFLSDSTLRQLNPWIDRFRVSTDEILERLPLGRLGLKSKSNKVDAVVKSLRALSRVLVRLDWENDPDYRRGYSDLWYITVLEAKTIDPSNGLPTRCDLLVAPGGWAELCLERGNGRRDVLWHGYAPPAITKQSSFTGRLLRHYHETTIDQFTVYEWLVGANGRTDIDRRLNGHRSKAKLKDQFFKALPSLTAAVRLGFDLEENPNDWLNTRVVRRVYPVVPVSIAPTDLKRTRLDLGMTQDDVVKLLTEKNYPLSRAHLSKVERNPGKYPDTANRIRRVLNRARL